MPPFQLEGSVKSTVSISASATSEEKRKLLELSKSLVSTIVKADTQFSDLSNKLLTEEVQSAVDIAIQLRNMRLALNMVKGKRRKMSNPEARLEIQIEPEETSFYHLKKTGGGKRMGRSNSNSAKEMDQMDLKVLYTKEVEHRKKLELELQKAKKQIAELQQELQEAREELIERKKQLL